MLFVSLILACLALAVGLMTFALSRTSGVRRGPSNLFVAAGIYAAADGLGYASSIGPETRSLIASAVVACSGFFLVSAVRHVALVGGHLMDRSVRVMQAALGLSIVVCLVPGAVYSTDVVPRQFPFVASTYYDTEATVLGYLVFVVYFGSLVTVFLRTVADWRERVPLAGYHMAAFGVLVLATAADLASSLQWSPLPYVLTEGIFIAAMIFAGAILQQVSDDRTALDRLRAELEQRVAERTRELERRTEELSRSERLAVVGRLAAGIAHELNNPAAAIKASLDDARGELLRRGGSSAEVLACIDISIAAVERVTRIVRQLGAMAGGAETLDQARASTNLALAVQVAVNSARDHLRPEVTLKVTVDEGLYVRALATAAEESIKAIVVNAVEAVPDGQVGKVDISARVEDDTVLLVVRDSGTGMREEDVARAFEPFYTTKELGRSSGLGLSVAKGLMETMGGSLELRSIIGVGTEAIIRFRLGEAAELSGPKRRAVDITNPRPVYHASSRVTSVPGVPATPERRARILLVDDDDLVRVAMRRYLARIYDVDAVGTVVEGLAQASRAYDVILSDVVMPDGGGQRLYLELLARDPELAARVIFITGGAFRGDLQDFLGGQAQPVLNKPVRLSELTEAIGRLVPADE